jgi:hypothetical protein
MIPFVWVGLVEAFLVSNFSVSPRVNHEWRSRRTICPDIINVSFVANNSFFQFTLGKTADHPPEYITDDSIATFLFCEDVSGMLVENNQIYEFITAANNTMYLEPTVSQYLKTVESTCSPVPTTIEFGIIVGYEAWNFWELNEDTVTAYISLLVMQAAFLFKQTFLVELKHTQTIISKDPDSRPDLNGCESALDTVKSMPNAILPQSGFWILLNDCIPDAGAYTAGIAYIGGLCSAYSQYGVVYIDDTIRTTLVTFLHEIGHVFGGEHPFEAVFATLDTNNDAQIAESEWNEWYDKIDWAPGETVPAFSVIDADGNSYINETEIKSSATGLQGKFQTIMDYQHHADILYGTKWFPQPYNYVNMDIMCNKITKERESQSCPYITAVTTTSTTTTSTTTTLTTTTLTTTTDTTITTTTTVLDCAVLPPAPLDPIYNNNQILPDGCRGAQSINSSNYFNYQYIPNKFKCESTGGFYIWGRPVNMAWWGKCCVWTETNEGDMCCPKEGGCNPTTTTATFTTTTTTLTTTTDTTTTTTPTSTTDTTTTPTSATNTTTTTTSATDTTTTIPIDRSLSWFTNADTNKDAKLSFLESGMTLTEFNFLDTDNDKFLSMEELSLELGLVQDKKTSNWIIIISASAGSILFIVVGIRCLQKRQPPVSYTTVPNF